MAKVQPLYGTRKFNWTVRLAALVTVVGYWALELGEDGTNRTSITLHRRGSRFSVTARVLGRQKNHDTCIIIHNTKTAVIMATRNNKLTTVTNIKTEEKLDDHKALYKLLERRVYATFEPDHAAGIMSRGDALYNALTRDY